MCVKMQKGEEDLREEDIRKKEAFHHYLELVKEDAEAFFNDKSDFGWKPCPACSSNQHKEEFQKTGFIYVSCEECGTLFANPRPPLEKLKRFYTEATSTRFWVEEFFKPVAEERRKKIFLPRAEYVVREIGGDGEWLIGDIGAGFGLFIEELRKLWPLSRFIAIEPSAAQAEICKQKEIEVCGCFIEEINEFSGRFDFLSAFELLEHILEPRRFIEKAYELLRPGGHLLLTTLNSKGFDILLLWEHHKSIFPPVHINFFNTKSISALLEITGFQVKRIETPGKLDWEIVENMISKEGTSMGKFWSYLASNGSKEAKQELQEWIQKNLLSSHMRILAQKPA